jgi:tetratricopeptide (TPR) repeat protein
MFPGHTWGVSATEDVKAIAQGQGFLNLFPDFPLYLLLGARFCERLKQVNGYDDSMAVAHIQNVEANLYRDYFRQTGEVPAGLRAIELFEECVGFTDDAFWKMMVEHNVAMAVYSVLSKKSGEIATLLARRPNLRNDGIRAAERALAILDEDKDIQNSMSIGNSAGNGAELQRARLHHILGDLRKLGNTQEELNRALKHLNLAIESKALDARLERGALESRAQVLGRLENSSETSKQSAIHDLEQIINNKESDRAWTEKYSTFDNLAWVYWETGQIYKALSLLEKSASLSLNEIEKLQDESILQQKGAFYIQTFEWLATIYAQLNKPKKALDAIESLRARTVRLSTMSAEEKAVFDQKSAERLLRETLAQLLGNGPSHTKVKKLRLQTVSPKLNKIRREVSDIRTAFVCFIIFDNKITAITIMPPTFFNSGVKSYQWEADEDFMKNLGDYNSRVLDPTPLRERRLKKQCEANHRSFLQPIISVLRKHRIDRVGISAPGFLSLLPFEAFSAADEAGIARDFVDEFQVFYLPSLTLGTDLIRPRTERKDSRLLAVGYLDEDLPNTRIELDFLKETWGDRMTFMEGTRCSKKDVLEEMEGEYDYIHFSGHGTFDILDPLDSALHLVARPHIDSHRITARNILDIRFKRSPIITMSACSSALTSFSTLNDLTGLTGSFLKAGARAVIGSRWDVYDDSSAAFMKDFYKKIVSSDSSPQKCFYETQVEAKQSGSNIEDWAAFGYLGLP